MGYGEIPSGGVQAYFKLENTSNSGSLTTGNLSNNNTVTFIQTKFRNGANFGSANTNKSLSFSNDLGIHGDDITMMGWFYPQKNDTSTQVSCRQGDAGTNVSYYFQWNVSGGTISIVRQKGPSTFNNTQITGLGSLANTWHHVCGTYNTGTQALNIYLNGVLRNTGTFSGNGTSGINDSFIIGGFTAASNMFSGYADEVIIDNRTWSASEIRKYYTYAKGRIAA